MLASPGTVLPDGPDWTHEIKWDGMRVLAEVSSGRLRLASRNELDVTVSFPELAGLSAAGPDDMLLDGEVVAMQQGRPSFAALAERMHVHDAARARALAAATPVTYLVFDLLRLYGVDVTTRPLAERRATLERLDLTGPHWRVPPTYDDGAVLRAATLEQGLEGVVSKRWSSRYLPGRRTKEWLKFPHRDAVSVVVGGWRLETDSDRRLGALLVGAPAPGGLRYLGRVGSGLAGREGARVLSQLTPLASPSNPFVDEVPRADALGSRWLRPQLVVDVRSLGGTAGGRLRQPSYQRLRPDLTPADLADPR
ncbi:MAG TPA: non-homologous end-joining DNA ligase [Dermatophilaceae bacterium]|nr:non-homologous end-joining DNA ligase [Dermatophilaceae bacterium]